MAAPPNGIIHNGGVPSGPRIHLPLEHLYARVLILDVGSRVSLTQRYHNPSDHPTSRAVYYFPVPARAAICSFELETSGKVVYGTCKEKTQAREEHEQAIASGQYTGLLEYVSDDIFTISVGSIAAKETVIVKLSFVMTLPMSERIRFHLPMAVGQRYGEIPEAIKDASVPSSRTRIRIKIDVQTSGTIQSLSSPSHGIKVEKYKTHLGRPSRRRATVRFSSGSFLADDFVLLVEADKLDAPRCFAQIYRDRQGIDTLAVQFALVPKFDMPPIRSQEYIFVVDRSGSMNGDRIETAKRTLTLLLRMLPKEGTFFNVFSFGDHTDSLWTRSNAYDQRCLDSATEHVLTMTANYGGTDIYLALDRVHRQRDTVLPTAVFMLTDGEASNDKAVVGLVRKAVSEATPSAPLRVYTLGIGSQVSTSMCEGIARAGNGVCLLATRAEDIMGKCARLLRAGRTPFVRNVKVDWGIPDSALAVSVTSDPPNTTYSPPNFQQAPTTIHDIHADIRTVIYALFQLRKPFSPQEVTLRGEIEETGQSFHLTVPIRGVQLADLDPQVPPIHTLAAHYLIREHEAGHAPLLGPAVVAPAEGHKQAIVYLGTHYQLVSEHTSFVAVEKPTRTQHRRQPSRPGGLLGTLMSVLAGSRSGQTSDAPQPPPSRTRDESVNISSLIPGGWPGSPIPATRNLHRDSRHQPRREEDTEDSDGTADSYSTMSSLEGSSTDQSYWTEAEDEPSEEDSEIQRSPSPQFGRAPPNPATRPSHDGRDLHLGEPAHIPPEIAEVLSLQKADGSFPLNNALQAIVGAHAVEEGVSQGVDRHVWATILCIAFLQKHMEQKDLRNDLLMKARDFLKGRVDVDVLLDRAMLIVQ